LVRLLGQRPTTADLTLALGPAGTGKTFLATAMAVRGLEEKWFDRLVLARPNISTGKTLGAFPGDANEKLYNWLLPLISNLQEFLTRADFDRLVQRKQLVLQPIETIRGQSFENSFVIIDEAQNLNRRELFAIVTRLGENSRMVLLGDPDQSDLSDSGLLWLTDLIVRYDLPASILQFSIQDIVRSDIVGAFVRALAEENQRK
jgi:phosphate starvation-inducible PhoH-like protein